MRDHPQFSTDRTYPGRWTVTFSNPPINMFVPETIVELGALMTELEADQSVQVVVFQSANPEFFVAHLDVAKAVERPEVLGLWRDLALRISSAPVVSVAKIRGRTRGIGNSPRRRPSSIGSGRRQQPRFSRASICCSPPWPRRVRRRAVRRSVMPVTVLEVTSN